MTAELTYPTPQLRHHTSYRYIRTQNTYHTEYTSKYWLAVNSPTSGSGWGGLVAIQNNTIVPTGSPAMIAV